MGTHLVHGDGVKTNRQYGLATASTLMGHGKSSDKPIIDLRFIGKNAQSEDAYIWIEDNTYKMIMRDMGYWNHEYGLCFESSDGVEWSHPKISFLIHINIFLNHLMD